MIRVILLILIFSSTCFAKGERYGPYNIPTVKGAYSVVREKNDRLHTYSLSYKLKVTDTNRVNEFYASYFKRLGWKDPIAAFSGVEEGKKRWNHYSTTFNSEGLPVVHYASTWEAQLLPATGVLNMTLTGYGDGKFYAKVFIEIAPEIDSSQIIKFQKELMEDPKNIFILHKAIGGNLFEFDRAIAIHEQEYKDKKIVKEYYEMLEKIKSSYNDFALKYIVP